MIKNTSAPSIRQFSDALWEEAVWFTVQPCVDNLLDFPCSIENFSTKRILQRGKQIKV
jgi:hypothetical protein